MKKTILAAVAMAAVFTLQAQTPRIGLVEEATQASCGPCAAANPGLQELMNENSDKVLFVAYQVWWPGFDPMYEDNSADIDARVGNYYDYSFAPQVKFNGSFPGGGDGGVSTLTQAQIDDHHAEMSEFDLAISAEVLNGSLVVTGSLDATADVSGDLKLHLILMESTIYAADAPGGTNGETEYHHVMKKFLPGTSGIDLADAWTAGESYTINESYPLGGINIYDWSKLEVLAFVQNDDDKFVHQAAKDAEIPITVDVENNVAAGEISGTPAVICAGSQTVTPVFTLINGGNETLTSADIVYSANGGATQTFSWTGSLETFASEDVTVDPITFDASSTDNTVLNFSVQNPNGAADELATDDMSSLEIAPAPQTYNVINVSITTDGYGDELYWEIRTDGGVLASGGNPNVGLDNIGTGEFPPAADPNAYGNNETYDIEVVLPDGVDCYTFHITDYYGDGLLGTGGYVLTDSFGNELHDDSDDYQVEAVKNISGEGAVGLTEQTLDSQISVFPNPAANTLNVRYNIEAGELVTFDLIDARGAKVVTRTITSSGADMINFDVAGLESGIYQLNTTTASGFGSTTITVAH